MWKRRCKAKFSFQVCIYTHINILAYCRKSDVIPFISDIISSVFLSEIVSVSVFSYSVSGYLLRAALIKTAIFWRRYFVLHCLPPMPRPKMLFTFWIFLRNVITLMIKSIKNMPNKSTYNYRCTQKKFRFCNHMYSTIIKCSSVRPNLFFRNLRSEKNS